MVSYHFVPISSQKGVLFFETPGNTIASVALVHTSKQSDRRMQTKEILSSRI